MLSFASGSDVITAAHAQAAIDEERADFIAAWSEMTILCYISAIRTSN
jgi:hypothetical protein